MSSLNVLQRNIAKLNLIPNVLKILRFTCNANGIRTLSIDVITFVAWLLFGKYLAMYYMKDIPYVGRELVDIILVFT